MKIYGFFSVDHHTGELFMDNAWDEYSVDNNEEEYLDELSQFHLDHKRDEHGVLVFEVNDEEVRAAVKPPTVRVALVDGTAPGLRQSVTGSVGGAMVQARDVDGGVNLTSEAPFSSLQGHLTATYAELVERLGPPTYGPERSGDVKTRVEWVVETSRGEVRVYDFKEWDTPVAAVTTWHLGARGRGAPAAFVSTLRWNERVRWP